MDNSTQALSVKLITFSDASLPALQLLVANWLAGKTGLTSQAKLMQFDLKSDGTTFYAFALFVE